MEQDLALHDTLETLITTIETQIAHLSTTDPWAPSTPYLIQIPGMGVLTAMTILAAIGDITRFPSAKHLVGYSGLAASVHASGDTQRMGRITKEGRRDLRRVMVEAAWIAVNTHPHWKDVFARLSQRIGVQKAIVAIARKLVVVVWHVLTKAIVDQHGDADVIARKLMKWASQYRLSRHTGRSRGAFVRQHLDQLGIGDTLTTVRFAGRLAPLPPPGQTTDPPGRHRA